MLLRHIYFGLRGAYAHNLPQTGAIVGQLWAIFDLSRLLSSYFSVVSEYVLSIKPSLTAVTVLSLIPDTGVPVLPKVTTGVPKVEVLTPVPGGEKLNPPVSPLMGYF